MWGGVPRLQRADNARKDRPDIDADPTLHVQPLPSRLGAIELNTTQGKVNARKVDVQLKVKLTRPLSIGEGLPRLQPPSGSSPLSRPAYEVSSLQLADLSFRVYGLWISVGC